MSRFANLDFYFQVARGAFSNMSVVRKYGRNDDIDNGQTEDIWAGGGTRTYLTSASTIDVRSDDSNDDGSPAGTGARTLVLEGLDASYNEISETITLNGGTQVTSSNSYLRLHRAYVATAGSSGTNEGSIAITATTGGSTQGGIAPGDGQTLITHYTIPAGKTGYLVGGKMTLASKDGAAGVKEAKARLWERLLGGAWRIQGEFGGRSDAMATSGDLNFTVPQSFPAKTDIKWTAYSDTNNSSVYIQYNLILVDD